MKGMGRGLNFFKKKNPPLNSLLTGESFQSNGQNFDKSQASNCGQIS